MSFDNVSAPRKQTCRQLGTHTIPIDPCFWTLPSTDAGNLPGHTPALQNGGVASYEVDERGVAIAQLWDSLAPQI